MKYLPAIWSSRNACKNFYYACFLISCSCKQILEGMVAMHCGMRWWLRKVSIFASNNDIQPVFMARMCSLIKADTYFLCSLYTISHRNFQMKLLSTCMPLISYLFYGIPTCFVSTADKTATLTCYCICRHRMQYSTLVHNCDTPDALGMAGSVPFFGSRAFGRWKTGRSSRTATLFIKTCWLWESFRLLQTYVRPCELCERY